MTAATKETVFANGLPCHLVDPEIFFAEDPAEIEYAKGLCTDCPARAACLAAALERGEACGVWGGALLINGAIVARKRPRGRPRKNPLPLVAQAPAHIGRPAQAGESGRGDRAAA